MFRRTSALLLASWLAVPGLSLAEGLDPEKVARIRREEAAELAKVDKAHGNKKSSEMDNDERRQVMEEQASASERVLEKHGVTAREYANYTARMGREESQAVLEATARLEAEEKAKQEAAAKEQAGPREVVIQQGISDKNPVMLEGSPDEDPIIEQGLDVEDSPRVAAADEGREKKAKKPSRRSKKEKRKRRERYTRNDGDD